MNINPAVTAYSNLNITDAELEQKPKKSSNLNEPRDRVRDYVNTIRKKRKQINNGR